MTEIEANKKFVEVAKLLGMETDYFSGMHRVRLNGQWIGQMSAEAWMDHIKNCVAKSCRT